MQYRTVGKSDLQVSPIIFGGNVFGWTLDESQSLRMLDALSDQGINTIDTADTYSRWVPGNKGGESEQLIGKWLQQKGGRDKIIIATKVGGDMGSGKKSLSADYILQEAEASLRRLQTDYIDLYQSHYDDPETPVAETLKAYDQLICSGKVRYIGASNFSVDRLQQSQQTAEQLGLARYQSLQPEYNLYARAGFEQQWTTYLEQSDMAVLTYYSLASGFLSGKYRSEGDLSKSPRGQGIQKYLNARGYRILNALDAISAHHHTEPAAVALAWLHNKPLVTAAIASATTEKQLQVLTTAASLVLDDHEMQELDQASA